jgi:hypothetical protein
MFFIVIVLADYKRLLIECACVISIIRVKVYVLVLVVAILNDCR